MSSDSRWASTVAPMRWWRNPPKLTPDPTAVAAYTVERKLARTAARRELLRPSSLLLMATCAGIATLLLWALHNAFMDDAYISLDYARTLAFHGQWGLLPGIPANTATSPLNIMILGALTFVSRNPMAALWIVTITNAVFLAAGLIRLGSRWQVGARLAWIAAPLLLLNPLLASSIGLETMMAVTLLVWLLDCGMGANGRRFGWLSGLGMVLRPDLVVIIGVVWLCHPGLRKPHPIRTTLGTAWRAAVIGLPWYVFSWFYFGSAIPDTLAIKQDQVWGDFLTGLWQRYDHLYPAATRSVLILAGLGLAVLVVTPLLAFGRYRPVALSVASSGLAGLTYFGAYTQLGVPPYFWYYGIPIAGLTMVLAFAVAALTKVALSRQVLASRALCALLVTALLTPALIAWGEGLAKEAPLREAPIHGNWALPREYERIGLDLANEVPPGAVVRSAGEFGTILYYCDCTLLDRFDQRGLVMHSLMRAQHSSWLMGLNYANLDPSKYPLLHQDYHLVYADHHVHLSEPGVWDVWSPTKRAGHYMLKPGPRPSDLEQGLAP